MEISSLASSAFLIRSRLSRWSSAIRCCRSAFSPASRWASSADAFALSAIVSSSVLRCSTTSGSCCGWSCPACARRLSTSLTRPSRSASIRGIDSTRWVSSSITASFSLTADDRPASSSSLLLSCSSSLEVSWTGGGGGGGGGSGGASCAFFSSSLSRAISSSWFFICASRPDVSTGGGWLAASWRALLSSAVRRLMSSSFFFSCSSRPEAAASWAFCRASCFSWRMVVSWAISSSLVLICASRPEVSGAGWLATASRAVLSSFSNWAIRCLSPLALSTSSRALRSFSSSSSSSCSSLFFCARRSSRSASAFSARWRRAVSSAAAFRDPVSGLSPPMRFCSSSSSATRASAICARAVIAFSSSSRDIYL